MYFEDFKQRIESIFSGKFADSLCDCHVFNCCGKSIYIDCTLGKNDNEYANGIKANDCMHVVFQIFMPNKWTEDQELPESIVLESHSSNFVIKPKLVYTSPNIPGMYCNYRKVPYRKTKGSPEKIIDTFKRYTDKLYDALKAEYTAENLLPRDMEIIKNKGYFKEA